MLKSKRLMAQEMQPVISLSELYFKISMSEALKYSVIWSVVLAKRTVNGWFLLKIRIN